MADYVADIRNIRPGECGRGFQIVKFCGIAYAAKTRVGFDTDAAEVKRVVDGFGLRNSSLTRKRHWPP